MAVALSNPEVPARIVSVMPSAENTRRYFFPDKVSFLQGLCKIFTSYDGVTFRRAFFSLQKSGLSEKATHRKRASYRASLCQPEGFTDFSIYLLKPGFQQTVCCLRLNHFKERQALLGN